MREIKFRQPIYVNGKFDRWHYWGFFPDAFYAPYMEKTSYKKSQQYTGLNDNTQWKDLTDIEKRAWLATGKTAFEWNGKEIYEGDIVQWAEKLGPALVRMGTLYEGDDKVRTGWIVDDCFVDDRCKKIGDIYENPELIAK